MNCDDCKWQKVRKIKGIIPEVMCSHEGKGADGELKPLRACVWERSEAGNCGPDGQWWEAKE
jgi:hypothetical protein